MKGRTLPVTANVAIDASSMLQVAIEKHAKHFQLFNTACKYVLLYPDHTIVNTLPGSMKRFTLEAYKEDLGKTYSKIYLWLCKQEDYEAFAVVESDPEGNNLTSQFAERTYADNACKTPSVIVHDQVATSSTNPLYSAAVPRNTIIPYLSSTPNSTINQSKQAVNALCPICCQSFPVEVIASHADLCADAFDPIGEILEPIAVESDSDSNVNADDDIPNAETASQPSSLSKVQTIVAQLQMKVRLTPYL